MLHSRTTLRWILLAMFGGGVALPALAEDSLDREFEFASGLVSLNFADYADDLVKDIVKLHPEQAERAKVVQVEILTGKRKFDEANAILKTMPPTSPKTQAARLAMANIAYRWHEIDRAKTIFEDYFKQYKDVVPTDPDLKRFYMDSAYRYAQMLEQGGDLKGAAAAYDKVLKCKPEEGIVKRLQSETASMLVRAARKETNAAEKAKMLDQAAALCKALQWSKDGIDLHFGNSIITLANIEIARGKPGEARKTIKNNLDLMSGLDDLLKQEGLPMSMSPLAGARALLGDLCEQEGNKVLAQDKAKGVELFKEALTHYVNVFAKYGDSEWGPEAGSKTEALKAKIEKLIGKPIKLELGPYRLKMVDSQSRLAENLYGGKQYADALKAYLRLLNWFPDSEKAGDVLAKILLCYANLKDDLFFDATMEYIGERYRRDPAAGTALLAAAKYFYDQKDEKTCVRLYKLFAASFPKHEKAPGVLYTLAGMLRKAGDEAGNQKYLKQLMDNFPQDQYYLKAMMLTAWSKYEAKDYPAASQLYRAAVSNSMPTHQRAIAQFLLADCCVRQNDFAGAVKEYNLLKTWLAPKEQNPYAQTGEETEKAKDLMEKASFFVGFCLSKIQEPKESMPQFRAKATELLNQFVADYPKSPLAPRALSVIGTIQLELGQMEAATKAFEDLGKRYPDSEDGKGARFALIRASIEIKKYDIANEAFAKMMANEKPGVASKLYSADQFVRVAQWMQDAGFWTNAAPAYEQALASGTTDRTILERTLYGLGTTYYHLKNYEKCIQHIEDMLIRYPRSGLFYDAKLILGRAYRQVGKTDDAIGALADVYKTATNEVVQCTASVELAQVQREKAKAAKAAGKADEAATQLKAAAASFERVGEFGNMNNPELRPLIEQALVDAMVTFNELGRYPDALNACEALLTKFPDSTRKTEVLKMRSDLKLKMSADAPAAPAPAAPAGGK